MKRAIRVENLSKAYQLGQFSTGTLSQDLHRWWAAVRGQEDPYLKIGETNDRTLKSGSNIVWSLKDINFEIQQGQAVGIIGRNGAGKSTLLKVLSQVTSPTSGNVKVKGRIASLLEVGTGFHPELTGRENIFLNGAILGMRKNEIRRKFDEIVDFSGVDRYVDTPVKRYSSGMYVRLAFAVAAHLESEILIVDEVLAVGDAEFQKKCLGKMGSVSKDEGRTVLFVSHNMDAVSKLCNSAIYLKNGVVDKIDSTDIIISDYLTNGMTSNSSNIDLTDADAKATYKNGSVTLKRLSYLNAKENTNMFSWDTPLKIRIEFDILQAVENFVFGFTVSSGTQVNLFTANNHEKPFSFPVGSHQVDVAIAHNLRHGTYVLHLGAINKGIDVWWGTEIATFEISSVGLREYPVQNSGHVLCNSEWIHLNK